MSRFTVDSESLYNGYDERRPLVTQGEGQLLYTDRERVSREIVKDMMSVDLSSLKVSVIHNLLLSLDPYIVKDMMSVDLSSLKVRVAVQ